MQAPPRGRASIVLRVMDSARTRSLPATVTLAELQLEGSVRAGLDTLEELPEGSWGVRVRSIGFEPRTLRLNARPSGSTIVDTVRLTPLVQTLDAVNVIARHDQKVLDGIDERMRVASGTLIRAGDPFLATATEPSDALRAGRGFIVRSPTDVSARGLCRSASSNLPTRARSMHFQEVAVYLDGLRLRGGLETLNNIIRPDDILAIETYPEVKSAPFLWRTEDACAVVAFWTKHPSPGSNE